MMDLLPVRRGEDIIERRADDLVSGATPRCVLAIGEVREHFTVRGETTGAMLAA